MFGEAGLAVELGDGPHGDARRFQRQQDEGEAVVALRIRIAAEQPEQPVGIDSARGPDLLAVDDIVIAVANSLGADGCHVGTGTRF